MNQVFNNNRHLFPNVTNERNFYANFWCTVSEFLKEQAVNGSRRNKNRNSTGTGGGNAGTSNVLLFIILSNLTLF